MVGTAKLFLDEVACGTGRLEDTPQGAAVSGVRGLYFIIHTEGIPTDVKLCPFQ